MRVIFFGSTNFWLPHLPAWSALHGRPLILIKEDRYVFVEDRLTWKNCAPIWRGLASLPSARALKRLIVLLGLFGGMLCDCNDNLLVSWLDTVWYSPVLLHSPTCFSHSHSNPRPPFCAHRCSFFLSPPRAMASSSVTIRSLRRPRRIFTANTSPTLNRLAPPSS